MCSPFRAGVMTGLDPHRPNNLVGNIITDNSYELPCVGTLPRGMMGWTTHRGKWHLGTDPTHPIRCGFREWSGSQENLGKGGYNNWTKTIVDPLGNVEVHEHYPIYATFDTYCDVLSDLTAGVGFIHASFNAVHKPLTPPPDYPPEDDDMAARLNMLEYMEGLLADLIVVALRAGYIVFLVGDNGTVGEGKNQLTEDGLNTPLYVFGTSVKAGESDILVQCTDLYATYRKLRGAPVWWGADAYDFSLDLVGDEWPNGPARKYHTCCDFQINGRVPKHSEMRRAVRNNDDWKLVDIYGVEALYRLPNETDNVINENPDIAAALRQALPRTEE